MSWFSTESVNSFAAGIGDQLQSVGDQLQNVQKNLTENNDLLQKLSLTTPELAEERRRIEEEEKRKERIRDSLAGMLPWETRDADRSILVEECKEAILNLSASKETFFGPYQMPETKIKIKEGKEGDGVKEETGDAKAIIDPSPETLENLSKLEPLPPLLDDFDLNAHVGLIQRLLKEDPKLVQMQSKLSGGGAREHVFWHNYFFHCAFTRYEAGMSIDEIWSDQPLEPTDSAANEATQQEEEEICFDDGPESPPLKAFQSEPGEEPPTTSTPAAPKTESASGTEGSSVDSPPDDFEHILDDNQDDGGDTAPEDYELDELEAEILKELEDD